MLERFEGKRVLVVGLGRFGGGVGVTRWLARQGAVVAVTDLADASSLRASIDELSDVHFTLQLGGHDLRLLDSVDLAIINPAVDKRRSEFFDEIRRRGIKWTTETNLFCERCPAAVVGVTGTYGKSTTCAMLGHMFEACRKDSPSSKATPHRVWLGGNIGRSLLDDLGDMTTDDIVILELSSAQLEDLPRIDWRPHIAVVTNMWPHHLDRYESPAEYFSAKLNIVSSPQRLNKAIVGELCSEAAAVFSGIAGAWAKEVVRVNATSVKELPGCDAAHDGANAACALAACRMLGVDVDIAQRALASFTGLPHRMEHVRVVDDVLYINDSKATAAVPTMAAIEAVQRPIVLLLGGRSPGKPSCELVGLAAKRCRRVICLGESGAGMAEAIKSSIDATGGAVVEVRKELADAFLRARQIAEPGDCVLFSPAAQSFDSFTNFAQRGERFRQLVEQL